MGKASSFRRESTINFSGQMLIVVSAHAGFMKPKSLLGDDDVIKPCNDLKDGPFSYSGF